MTTAISREIHTIPQDILRGVMEAFPHRTEKCIQARSGYLENAIFKVH
jgi:hypothetical protein